MLTSTANKMLVK